MGGERERERERESISYRINDKINDTQIALKLCFSVTIKSLFCQILLLNCSICAIISQQNTFGIIERRENYLICNKTC